jgi:Predicted phosphoesterase (MutT family)
MSKTQAPSHNKHPHVFLKEADEKILVVNKNILFSYQVTQGLTSIDFDRYQLLIQNNKKFLWRSKVEQDNTYKQIIPYLVFTYNQKYFVMRRKSDASEVRLQNKYSLGIGGHIRKEDLKRNDIIEWAHREFKEEVSYNDTLSIEPLGLLNDERDSVGEVHAGFAFLLHGTSENISIRKEHKEGTLLTLDECSALYNQMESWSQILIEHLKRESPKRRTRPCLVRLNLPCS